MRATLLAIATATTFGGRRSISEVSHGARGDQCAGGVDDGPAGFWILNRCEQGEALARCGARGVLAHGFDELSVQLLGLTGREEATVVAAGGPCERKGALW